MGARIHPTAIVEDGVDIGDATSVWDNCHIRGPETRIGSNCIIGEKSYVAYGVVIGDLVKINAFVYIPTAVTIERGVMISAHTVFTNDRFPRSTTPDLSELRTSAPDEHTEPTLVKEGTTIGARAVIGPGITLGRFSMIGMGAVVTSDVPDFHLVIGSPARTAAVVCRCGDPVIRGTRDTLATGWSATCKVCGRTYSGDATTVVEANPA